MTGSPQPHEEIGRLLSRGIADIIPREELERRLRARLGGRVGDKLRIYYGVDPSSPVIHLGHAVGLRKLRQFQQLGHTVILLIGDFTGRIGDPTDRSAARAQLTHQQVLENARTYTQQAAKILDFASPTNPVEVRYNGEWWDRLTARDLIELAALFTAQQIMERDMFQERLSQGRPIGLHEFLYPLLQGYDSVALDTDAELGGTDQTFNMLAGRTLLRALRQKEKIVITVPLLEGTDGRKMSKSFNNVIGVSDPPHDIYGRVMSLRDELIVKYFDLATDVPEGEVAAIAQELESGKTNPMLLKKRLARQVVAQYHSAAAAEEAERAFEREVQRREVPEEVPVVRLDRAGPWPVVDLLVACRLVGSRSAAKRLVSQGGVSIDSERVTDPAAIVNAYNGAILRAGKRQYARIAC